MRKTYLQQFPNPLPAQVVEFPHSPFVDGINVPVGSGGEEDDDEELEVRVDEVEDEDVREVEELVGVGVGVGVEVVDVVVGSAGASPQRPYWG